jgi:hypothetical protein
MNTRTLKPRLAPPGATGALIAAIGFGAALWFGWERFHLRAWTPTEIEQSVDLNLALDLSKRQGPALSDGEVQLLREDIREEVRMNIARDRERPGSYMLIGLLVGLIGVGQAAVSYMLRPR